MKYPKQVEQFLTAGGIDGSASFCGEVTWAELADLLITIRLEKEEAFPYVLDYINALATNDEDTVTAVRAAIVEMKESAGKAVRIV